MQNLMGSRKLLSRLLVGRRIASDQPRCRLLLLGVSRVRIPLQRQQLRLRVRRLRPVVNRVARTTRPVYAEKAIPGDCRQVVKTLREERFRLAQPTVASRRGLFSGRARTGCAASRRALVPLAPTDGVTGVSRVCGRPTRRGLRRGGLSKGEAMPAGGLWGRKLAAPAPGCSLGRAVQGVRKGDRKRDAFARTVFLFIFHAANF